MSDPKSKNLENDESAEVVEDQEEREEQVVEALPAEMPEEDLDPETLGLELPDGDAETIGYLLSEVKKARDDATSYLDDLQRVAADFDNFRKRMMRDTATVHQRAAEKVIQALMPVLDTFDAAVNTQPGTDGERQLYAGMINTREQLLKALEAEGLEVIPTIDEPFNPEIHEPIGAPAGEGELVVSQELRRGYRLNEKVLRAALVVLDVKE